MGAAGTLRSRDARLVQIAALAAIHETRPRRASSIEVRIAPEKDKLRIEVVDDGVGGAAEGQGSGLEGLRDRAEAIGGTMKLSSRAGQGTLVAVAIPSSVRGF